MGSSMFVALVFQFVEIFDTMSFVTSDAYNIYSKSRVSTKDKISIIVFFAIFTSIVCRLRRHINKWKAVDDDAATKSSY